MAYTKQYWQNETLSAPEAYIITDGSGAIISANAKIELATEVVQEGSRMTAERMNHIENGIYALNTITADQIPDGSITAEKFAPNAIPQAGLPDGAVTTSKIADGAVTAAKLGINLAAVATSGAYSDLSGAPAPYTLGDSAVTTAKIADGAVTAAKIATGAIMARHSAVNVPVSAWANDATYTAYPKAANISLPNVTATMTPYVVFNLPEAADGNYAPIANCYAGGVKIWAKAVPSAAITIPTILVFS